MLGVRLRLSLLLLLSGLLRGLLLRVLLSRALMTSAGHSSNCGSDRGTFSGITRDRSNRSAASCPARCAFHSSALSHLLLGFFSRLLLGGLLLFCARSGRCRSLRINSRVLLR